MKHCAVLCKIELMPMYGELGINKAKRMALSIQLHSSVTDHGAIAHTARSASPKSS
jgi:hypothetical protein